MSPTPIGARIAAIRAMLTLLGVSSRQVLLLADFEQAERLVLSLVDGRSQ